MTEPEEIVSQRPGQVALLAQIVQAGCTLALRKRRTLWAEYQRQVAVLRHGPAERLEQKE